MGWVDMFEAWLDRREGERVCLDLRDVVKGSHCDLERRSKAVCIVVAVAVAEVHLTGPSLPSVLVARRKLEGEEVQCDIHAKDQSLVCDGLDARTVYVQKEGDGLTGVVEVRVVERMGCDVVGREQVAEGVVEMPLGSSAMDQLAGAAFHLVLLQRPS